MNSDNFGGYLPLYGDRTPAKSTVTPEEHFGSCLVTSRKVNLPMFKNIKTNCLEAKRGCMCQDICAGQVIQNMIVRRDIRDDADTYIVCHVPAQFPHLMRVWEVTFISNWKRTVDPALITTFFTDEWYLGSLMAEVMMRAHFKAVAMLATPLAFIK